MPSPMTDSAVEPREASPLASSKDPVPGRLVTLTGASLLVSLFPLPFVPSRIVRQVRGAIVHDCLSRHGISVSSDARKLLAAPGSEDKARDLLRKAAEYFSRRVLRRLGPLAPLSTAVTAFEVFALGHLIERYLDRFRPSAGARMQEVEARRLRHAIDRAVLETFYPSTSARPLLLSEGSEDLRDEFTRWIDTLVLTGATLPNYLARRLEAAFDAVMEGSAGASDD
jgi:hypothetical protein